MNKRILLLFAFIISFNVINAQEPECQNLNIDKTPSTCTIPSTTLEAKFKNTEYRTTIDYSVSQEDVACPPPIEQTPPVGIVIDDGYSYIINIGFTFCFYGNMYDQLVVNDNGFVTFDLSVHDSHDFNTYTIPATPVPYLPTPQEQTNAIYACWVDTFTPNATNPEYAIQFRLVNQDEPGNRIFIVDWKDVPMYGNSSEQLSASLYLYETSNVIETNIYDVGSSSTNNGRGLIGIQNKSGTLGFSAPGRDTGTWPANFNGPEKYRFFPDGDTLNYSFQWFADFNHDGDFTDDGECLYCDSQEEVPNIIEVRPETETEYMAKLEYQGECSWDPVSPTIEIVSVQPISNAPILNQPDNQYRCEETLNSGEAVFNLRDENPLQDFDQDQIDNLFTVIYFYETDEDGDNIMDHVVEITGDTTDEDGNTIPLLDYFRSIGREIQILVELDCTKDFDGDGMNNCEDPYPETACDVNDANEDCDGDGIKNGVDTDPLVYGPCNEDFDGDGMFNCADPNPDSFCDVNNPAGDCDGDGLNNGEELTGVDDSATAANPNGNITDPLVAEDCNTTNPNGDCDNDGINNANDPDVVCDIHDCDANCDGDPLSNCLDIEPNYAYTNCNSALIAFNINVLALEDTFFEYTTPICTSDETTSPQNLPVYNDPSNLIHLYTINNGGVWVNPLVDITQSTDGIIDIEASGNGDDNSGNFTITHTIENTYNNLDLNGTIQTNVTCNDTSEFTIHINVFQDASFDYPTVACKDDDITDWPLATNFIGTTDFEISTGGILSDASNGTIDLENTPAGTYTISHTLINGSCTDTASHEITIYNAEFNYPNNDVLFCNDGIDPISEMPIGEYTINNGGVLANTTTGEIDLSASNLGNDGTGIFEVTHTINGECSYVLEITIDITKDASFDFPSEICSYENNPQATNIATNGGVFSINNGANINSNGVLDLTTITEGETYEIKYEFNIGSLCYSFYTQDILINYTPTATIPTTILTECNNGDGTGKFDVLSLENEIVGSQSGMTLTFHLTEQEAKDNTNAIVTSPYARVSGNIWARVESMEGCYNVIEIPLVVEDCYAVLPQAFSPNSSITENQTFNVRNLRETYPNFKLYIYNRYGNLVYEGDSSTDNWNGKLNNDGDLLPTGTYFYGIKLNDEQELQYRGWVYLQE
jgi:gliding motility-associated-like protein